jgi:hypothetical protein
LLVDGKLAGEFVKATWEKVSEGDSAPSLDKLSLLKIPHASIYLT